MWNINKSMKVAGKYRKITENWHMGEVFRDPVVYSMLKFFFSSKIKDMFLSTERNTKSFCVGSFGLWRLNIYLIWMFAMNHLLGNLRIHWFWEGHSKRDSVTELNSCFVTCALQWSRSNGLEASVVLRMLYEALGKLIGE